MYGRKISLIIFAIAFGIISGWLVIIPSYKMSGYVPSLNKKIMTILTGSNTPIIKLSNLGFWDFDISIITFPLSVDNEIVKIIAEISTKPIVKDGYRRKKETKYGNLDVFLDNKEYLFIHLAWDNVREIMELRFDDTNGNTKRRFYKISNKLAEKAFNLITQDIIGSIQ
jgi:hypothetical protein